MAGRDGEAGVGRRRTGLALTSEAMTGTRPPSPRVDVRTAPAERRQGEHVSGRVQVLQSSIADRRPVCTRTRGCGARSLRFTTSSAPSQTAPARAPPATRAALALELAGGERAGANGADAPTPCRPQYSGASRSIRRSTWSGLWWATNPHPHARSCHADDGHEATDSSSRASSAGCPSSPSAPVNSRASAWAERLTS